eukprot:8432483-Alexandrium_andersonii.AAC.1
MQLGVKHSELELRGPREALSIGLRSSQGVHSAPLCAESDGDGETRSRRPERADAHTLRNPTRG